MIFMYPASNLGGRLTLTRTCDRKLVEMIYLAFATLAMVFLSGWSYLPAQDTVPITEWQVPWANTRPRDPYVDHRGRVWFVGQQGDYVAYLAPESGQFRRFDLAEGTGPHNLIVGVDGSVWYAGNRNAHIGRLDPETGEIARYPLPNPAARDPHTLVFDSHGDIWFTVQRGNFVGKLSVASGEIRLVRVPTPRARPYGVVIDGNNRAWVALFGTNKLATIDPTTMALEEITLPNEGARPRRIVTTSDGLVWYVDYARGYLGQLDPVSHSIVEWEMPGGRASLPYGMVADDSNRIWIVETGLRPNTLVGFEPAVSEFTSATAIPSGGGSVRHMFYHTSTREIWFGTDTNYIGRASVP